MSGKMRCMLVAGFALALAACSGEPAAPAVVAVARVVVTPSTSDMPAGGTLALTATPQDAQGNPLASRAVTWTSSDVGVATVSASGLVTSTESLGAATRTVSLTASSEGKSGSAQVTVSPVRVARIIVTPATVMIAEGDSVQLRADVRDSLDRALTGRTVVWTSTNASVASVSASGRLLATPYSGDSVRQANVSATSEGTLGSTTITVNIDYGRASSFFTLVPDGFPDLSREYNAIGNGGNIFTVVKADLNRDAREDLVFHMFHSKTPLEVYNASTPVPNRMVVFLANAGGTYDNKTAQLFGTADVDIGGALSRTTAWADVNDDGYPDWVYAMNREDGRTCGGVNVCPNWASPLSAAMSNGNGTYSMQAFGPAAYHHGIGLAKTLTGGFDVLGDDWAFSIVGKVFAPTAPYPTPGLHFTPASSIDGGPTDIIFDAIGNSLKLHTRQGGGAWTQRGTFTIPTVGNVPFILWNGDTSRSTS